MFFEDGKSNFSFLINGYLEREADFFPNEETRLNTYDSCIWYSPDGSEDNALIWPGIYQTSWLPELIDNFKTLLEGSITEFDFDMLLFDPLDFLFGSWYNIDRNNFKKRKNDNGKLQKRKN